MSIKIEPLRILIGQTIIKACTEINTLVPLSDLANDNAKGSFLFEIPLQLIFVNHSLLVYNMWRLTGSSLKRIEDLKNVTILSIIVLDQQVQFLLSDKSSIQVDMSDTGYIGPEAMVLYGPNDSIIAWN